MRNLIFLLFLGTVIFLVAGWILDWYDINSVKNSNGKTSIQFDIDRDKIKEDWNKGSKKLNDTWQQIQDEKPKTNQNTSTTLKPSGS
ncbi:MAG: hypothetical protein JNJ77_20195 [Planctomycetia bacterium]|nr:hypothetical protein [Planctomycetia bacterium]